MSATHAIVYLRLTEDSVEAIPLFGFDGDPEFVDYRHAVCDEYEHLTVRSADSVDEDVPAIRDEDGEYELVYRTPDTDGRPVVQNLERVAMDEIPSGLEEQVASLEHVRFQPFEGAPPFTDG